MQIAFLSDQSKFRTLIKFIPYIFKIVKCSSCYMTLFIQNMNFSAGYERWCRHTIQRKFRSSYFTLKNMYVCIFSCVIFTALNGDFHIQVNIFNSFSV